MVRWCWVNFQCRGVLQFGTVGQGPTALAVGAGGGCLDIFTLIYPFSPLSPSLWETAQYRLKYCLKGPLNPKQPTNQQPCGLKCVHSLLGKQEALPIMGQSLEKDSVKCFSYIGSKCPYREYLLAVCTTLAVLNTASTKRKTSKIRYIFKI